MYRINKCKNLQHPTYSSCSQTAATPNRINQNQGWEFAHLIYEWIARFLSKNERMSNSLKKMSDSLIYSFLVSDLSDSLIFGERPERFAHDCSFPLSDLSKSLMVAHFWWVIWAIRSHSSFDLSEMSDSLTKIEKMSKNERFAHFFKKNVF